MLRWYGIGLLLGVLRLLVSALPAGNALRSGVAIVLLVAILVWLVLTGRAAKLAGLGAPLQALLVGVCYGVPAGLAKVFFPATPAQVAAALQKVQVKVHLTTAQLKLAQQHMESAAAHWEGFVTVIVVYGVLGLLLGWIGSLLGRGTEESRAV